MYPVLLEFGPFTVYSYGVMMALGFVAAAWLLGKGLAYQGRNPDLASTLVLWAAVGGLLGARLLFILDNWSAFLADPWALLFTGAGFVWHGGLIGGIVGASVCIRHYKLPWLETMDAIAPAIRSGSWYRTPGLPISWRRGLGTPNRTALGDGLPGCHCWLGLSAGCVRSSDAAVRNGRVFCDCCLVMEPPDVSASPRLPVLGVFALSRDCPVFPGIRACQSSTFRRILPSSGAQHRPDAGRDEFLIHKEGATPPSRS